MNISQTFIFTNMEIKITKYNNNIKSSHVFFVSNPVTRYLFAMVYKNHL